MKSVLLIADGGAAPKSAALDSDVGSPRPWGRMRAAGPDRAKGGRLVALHDSLDAAGDPAALADCVEAIALRADRAAFASLFAYFAPRLKGYLMRLGLDGGQAEELAQEVMVAVWRKAGSYDRGQASVSTWIFRIARNRRIDLFRRDQRAELDGEDPSLRPEPSLAPDAAAEAAQTELRVRAALCALPTAQRDLVRAAFYEELSHSQIAERTGMPLGTVKSRLRQAFSALRGTLAGLSPSAGEEAGE